MNGRLTVGGREIVYDRLEGAGPRVVFMGGYASARKSVKASALYEWATKAGRAYLRFDYSGHGDSGGRFDEATLGMWLGETLAVIEKATEKGEPLLLVGSSMGGWLALLAALKLKSRVAGIITIACGADFTEEIIRPTLTPEVLAKLRAEGIVYKQREKGEEPTPLTLAFLEEAEDHLILGGPIKITCPVRLIHGALDSDVPWRVSLKVLERLTSEDATLMLVKDGDHRLSTPPDMARLLRVIGEFTGQGQKGINSLESL